MPTDPSSSASWEPPSLEQLQELLLQYEITEIIGRGGMGAVYKGRQTKLNRDVAIKLLPETFTQGEDELNFAKRFEQEAQAMAGLNHPAIIAVYDFGETDEGQLYFVMEYVDGLDIHQYLNQNGGSLPQEHALAITAHVLDALDYAHRNGIVHRDIKPANILLDSEGNVKIADFGLAKRAESADDSPALTMTNVAVGTPDFVAPEALDPDKTPDHRADLYAVGVMLYQMLTGTIPRGNFKLPSDLIPEIDPRIDGIIERSLETDPKDRYSSASEVRSALDPIFSTPMTKVEGGDDGAQGDPVSLGADDVVETPAKKKSQTPLLIGIGVAAMLVMGGIIAFVSGGGSKEQAPTALTGDATKKEPAPAQTERAEPENPPAPKPIVSALEPDKAKTSPKEASKESEPPEAPKEQKPPSPEVIAAEPAMTAPPVPEPAKGPVPAPVDEEPSIAPAEPTVDYAAIPNLYPRLNRFLAVRKTQVGGLASSYLRALDGKLNTAADAGELKLAQAFEAERQRVETLQTSLNESPASPVTALTDTATLTKLPEASPDELVTLRQTWTREREKIENTLETQLQQSLNFLERELTKARDFENAQTVLSLRESLFSKPTQPTAVAVTDPSEPRVDKIKSSPAEGVRTQVSIQGKLRASGTSTNGQPLDLSKVVPYEDLVEIAYSRSGFVARRNNGEIVSSHSFNPAPPGKVTTLVANGHASGSLFGLIDLNNRLTLHLLKSSASTELPHFDNVREAILFGTSGYTLSLDGTLRWFSVGNEAKTESEAWREPPPEAQKRIKSVVTFSHWTAVLDEDGRVTFWNQTGELTIPRDFEKGVVLIGRDGGSLSALNDDGELYRISIQNSDTGNAIEVASNRNIDALSTELPGLAYRDTEGNWDATTKGEHLAIHGDIYANLTNLKPGQFAQDFDPAKDLNLFLWIDPVENASQGSLTSIQNPFGWKEMAEDPFPLQRPTRPDVPCLLVAWRIDGKPVVEADFETAYGFLPDEIGEVVDVAITPSHVRAKACAFLNGAGDVIYSRMQGPKPLSLGRFEGRDIVQIDLSQSTLAMLDRSGKPHIVFHDEGMAKGIGLDYSDTSSWNDLVWIDAGFRHVLGLTAEGTPLTAGLNDRGQLDFPRDLRKDLIFLRGFGEATWGMSYSNREFYGERFGSVTNVIKLPQGERFFIDSQQYVTDEDGSLRLGGGEPVMSTHFTRAPSGLSDIRDAVSQSYPTAKNAGLVAVRTGESTWHFWGEREEVGFPFDPSLMQRKAQGALKLLFHGDYMLALKPAGSLSSGDWTGGSRQTMSQANPFDSPPPSDLSFPLPRHERPSIPCRMEVWRIDNQPMQPDEFREKAGFEPEELGTIVDLEAYAHQNGILISAVDEEGTVLYTKAQEEKTTPLLRITNRDVAQTHPSGLGLFGLKEDGTAYFKGMNSGAIERRGIDYSPIIDATDLVSITNGQRHALALKSDGTVIAAGHHPEDHYPKLSRDKTDIIKIEGRGEWSVLHQKSPDGIEVKVFGEEASTMTLSPGHRFLPSLAEWHWAVVDEQGTLIQSSATVKQAFGIEKMPPRLSNIRSYQAAAIGKEDGVAAVRVGDAQWHFWGDLGNAPLNADAMKQKADGCLKLFVAYPYVIGLKPIEGASPGSSMSYGASPSATTDDPSDRASSSRHEVSFPMHIPNRPSLAGRIEVHRFDGAPLGSSETGNALINIPPSIAGNAVAIDVAYASGEALQNGETILAAALLKDGTIRAWSSDEKLSKLLAQDPTLGISDVVKVEAGNYALLALTKQGKVFRWTPKLDSGVASLIPDEVGGEGEHFVDIALNRKYGLALTEHGKVVEVVQGYSKSSLPEDLPPIIMISAGYAGFLRDIHGQWHLWRENKEVFQGHTPTLPKSSSTIGPIFGHERSVTWLDENRVVRSLSTQGSLSGDYGPLKGKAPKRIFASALYKAAEFGEGDWLYIHGTAGSFVDEKIRGCADLAASHHYIFGIRPIGR